MSMRHCQGVSGAIVRTAPMTPSSGSVARAMRSTSCWSTLPPVNVAVGLKTMILRHAVRVRQPVRLSAAPTLRRPRSAGLLNRHDERRRSFGLEPRDPLSDQIELQVVQLGPGGQWDSDSDDALAPGR